MGWLLLLAAGLFEVGFTTCMRLSDGFKQPAWTAGFFLSAGLSFYLLERAQRTIPLGTAYAVWTGIGAVGTVLLGIVLFKEPATVARLVCVGLIVSGILGLKVLGSSDH